MKELVFRGESNQPLTNSKLVAEVFGKEHKHVLDAIRSLLGTKAENSALVENQELASMFKLIEVEQPMPFGGGVKKVPMYVMNQDGFTLLAMGFTGSKAMEFKLKYIAAFNKMKKEIEASKQDVPRNYLEALKSLVKSEEEKQALVETNKKQTLMLEQKQIENDQLKDEKRKDEPYTIFGKAMVGCTNSNIYVDHLAKIITQNGYKIGEKQLFAWLRDNGYLGKNKAHKNVPNQQYVNSGYFFISHSVFTGKNGELKQGSTTLITPKGQIYFVNKFLAKTNKQTDLFGFSEAH